MSSDEQPPDPRWVRALDLAVEIGLVGFAVFTLVHLVGAEAGWGVRTTGVLWLFLGLPAMAGMAWFGTRPFAAHHFVEELEPSPPPRARVAVFAGLALGAAVGCALLTGGAFLVPWALALLLAVVGVLWSRGTPSEPQLAISGRTRTGSSWAHLAAVGLAVAVGVFVLFVLNPSRDDVYYLNRAAWVAEQGTFPDRDTMFGPLTHPATYGAGLPIAALEEAYGSVARLLGVRAAGLAYLVANPVFAALSVWCTWRLVRTWTTARTTWHALAALVVAVAVPLFAGSGLLGEFAYAREWQGKVVVILLVMPLVWVHLTRLARGAPGDRWSIAMLGVLGAAWCGLTITAPIFAALLGGVGVLATLLLPDHRRQLALGVVALAAAPVLTGIATVLSSSGPVAEENFVSEPALVWAKVLGDDRLVVVLLGVALLLGPLCTLGREARVLAGLASVVTLGVLLPGVFDLVDTLTGTGPIAVRMLFTAPVAVLVGLLVVALPEALPAPARVAAYAPGLVAAVVVLGLAVSGTSVWSRDAHAYLAGSPTWKVKADDRAAVDAVLAERPGPGPVLLPPGPSRTLAITTTEVVAVVPRDYYVQFVQEPQAEHDARYAFRRFMDPRLKDPRPARLGEALETLDVSLACVPARAKAQQGALRYLGLTDERRLGGMVCFDGPGTGELTPPAGPAPVR